MPTLRALLGVEAARAVVSCIRGLKSSGNRCWEECTNTPTPSDRPWQQIPLDLVD